MNVRIKNDLYTIKGYYSLYTVLNEYLKQSQKDTRTISNQEWYTIIEPLLIDEDIIVKLKGKVKEYSIILQDFNYIPLVEDVQLFHQGLSDITLIEILASGYHYIGTTHDTYVEHFNKLIKDNDINGINNYIQYVKKFYTDITEKEDFDSKGFLLEVYEYIEGEMYHFNATLLKDVETFNTKYFIGLSPLNIIENVPQLLADVTKYLIQNPEKFKLNHSMVLNDLEFTVWDNEHYNLKNYGMNGYIDDCLYYMVTFKGLNDVNPKEQDVYQVDSRLLS